MWVDSTATRNNWKEVAQCEFTQWGGGGCDGLPCAPGKCDGTPRCTSRTDSSTLEFRCDCPGPGTNTMHILTLGGFRLSPVIYTHLIYGQITIALWF